MKVAIVKKPYECIYLMKGNKKFWIIKAQKGMPKKHFYVPKKMYRFILLDSKFLKLEGVLCTDPFHNKSCL